MRKAEATVVPKRHLQKQQIIAALKYLWDGVQDGSGLCISENTNTFPELIQSVEDVAATRSDELLIVCSNAMTAIGTLRFL